MLHSHFECRKKALHFSQQQIFLSSPSVFPCLNIPKKVIKRERNEQEGKAGEWERTKLLYFLLLRISTGCKVRIIMLLISEFCQEDSAFQCYDGSCLPMSRYCDNTIDCPGLAQEDELCTTAQDTNLYRTCADWRMKGHTENKEYPVNPTGNGGYNIIPTINPTYDCQLYSITHDTEMHLACLEFFQTPFFPLGLVFFLGTCFSYF